MGVVRFEGLRFLAFFRTVLQFFGRKNDGFTVSFFFSDLRISALRNKIILKTEAKVSNNCLIRYQFWGNATIFHFNPRIGGTGLSFHCDWVAKR